ncbi:hypothetical protein [Bradyrhizobium sp. JYMT SZCCT0428]|uniref:hypothetical protein n=1 Tax=Bradyrhizobium sp. JYMT SZCCT0428 TaxID=2807673 RepID=UPI001BA84951|nr:hypothetical protein [Bradyrhizobium sp. JYMT SZCCT0428]MBR1154594.1 hypothetical protein [Bradyrhizobium sp. JYMT SZCCT0428]
MLQKAPADLVAVRKVVFDPTSLTLRDLSSKLKVIQPRLPAGWVAGRMPIPSWPVDEYVKELLRKRSISHSAEVQSTFGSCSYAIARYGVHLAVGFAHEQYRREAEIKEPIVAALKYLKDNDSRLRAILKPTRGRVQSVLEGVEDLGFSLSRIESLAEALLVSEEQLIKARPLIKALHLELSRKHGVEWQRSVWRRSFVKALFSAWWWLTEKDPKSSAGPFQRFVIASWCSLSPEAAPDDADWKNAISGALSNSRPGEWHILPDGRLT